MPSVNKGIDNPVSQLRTYVPLSTALACGKSQFTCHLGIINCVRRTVELKFLARETDAPLKYGWASSGRDQGSMRTDDAS